jgi:hypothetical protein
MSITRIITPAPIAGLRLDSALAFTSCFSDFDGDPTQPVRPPNARQLLLLPLIAASLLF